MLGQRVITAVIMLAVLLGALLVPTPWPLVALLTAMAGCALWEWLRLTWPRRPSRAPVACAAALACVLAVLAAQWLGQAPARFPDHDGAAAGLWLLSIVVAAWIFIASAMIFLGRSDAARGSMSLSVFGIFAVFAAWTALVRLFLSQGAWHLVSLLALVWFADIGAYFAGKAFGRHKLAPKVSPGKTWEGAAGGVLAATLWVVASSHLPGSFAAALRGHWSLAGIIAIAVILAALSIVGDLFESLLKRRAGVKDSSGLLPGHGGVYDRIDALIPVAPAAFLLIMGLQWP